MIGTETARQRVIIEAVTPDIEEGRFPAKRVVGERVTVEADIFADGHDSLLAVLLYRREGESRWKEAPMEPLVNDRWRGTFDVGEIGRNEYTIQAWVDRFGSWQRDLFKKVEAEQDVSVDLLTGAGLLEQVKARASSKNAEALGAWVEALGSAKKPIRERVKLALDGKVAAIVRKYPDRGNGATYPKTLAVVVDREKARFSTWYEMFPRSSWGKQDRHGTFRDCEARLAYVADMGFDVLYLPPVHPVGYTDRKGKNNALGAARDDPGTPWAIGSKDGGHKSIHPDLGTLEDFRRFVAKAREQGIEVALDIAFQCSPDHPYVKKHPEWFVRRPDGSVQYAENPPKKYQDIYPFNFDTEQWQELWQELKSIFEFWIEQGVRVFRVDNPHTKPFAFWEWVIGELKESCPDLIFLAEAFTRPKIMYRLAKLGFTQSYTYFAWRNTKWELTQYFTELTTTDLRDYFRPSLWPNTPDILTEYLQYGGRPAYMARLVLAATLGASYGIYGPAFELMESRAREAGSEEYLDSEKYEIKQWDTGRADSLSEFVALVNRIRRENPALQSTDKLRFHGIPNEQLICYSKRSDDSSNVILVVVNLDPHHTQSGWVDLSLEELGITDEEPYQVHDLLSGTRHLWQGPHNYVELNPHSVPAHIFLIRRKVRAEHDFDYYM
jgi:starch synthase (maltosyl-transferring)